MRCSFKIPSHFGGLHQHWPTRCHSQLGLGVTVWRLGQMSFCADSRVLFQHAWNWFFSTSLFYSHSRYTHCCHTVVCCGCAPCSQGRASWLPWMWAFDDCVQRRDDVYFLRAPFWLGWSSVTPCKTFAKGPRFMNMVMTFVLHPLSHYNSIIESRARFLLSLLEHPTIDFPSHFILSIIDVYRDTVTRDKLIFPSVITRILCHFSIPFPSSDHFSVMCAINAATVKRSEA